MKTFVVQSKEGNRLFILTSNYIETALNQLKDRINNLPSLSLNHRELGTNDIIDINISYS